MPVRYETEMWRERRRVTAAINENATDIELEYDGRRVMTIQQAGWASLCQAMLGRPGSDWIQAAQPFWLGVPVVTSARDLFRGDQAGSQERLETFAAVVHLTAAVRRLGGGQPGYQPLPVASVIDQQLLERPVVDGMGNRLMIPAGSIQQALQGSPYETWALEVAGTLCRYDSFPDDGP